jgi:hypothetical protein
METRLCLKQPHQGSTLLHALDHVFKQRFYVLQGIDGVGGYDILRSDIVLNGAIDYFTNDDTYAGDRMLCGAIYF